MLEEERLKLIEEKRLKWVEKRKKEYENGKILLKEYTDKITPLLVGYIESKLRLKINMMKDIKHKPSDWNAVYIDLLEISYYLHGFFRTQDVLKVDTYAFNIHFHLLDFAKIHKEVEYFYDLLRKDISIELFLKGIFLGGLYYGDTFESYYYGGQARIIGEFDFRKNISDEIPFHDDEWNRKNVREWGKRYRIYIRARGYFYDELSTKKEEQKNDLTQAHSDNNDGIIIENLVERLLIKKDIDYLKNSEKTIASLSDIDPKATKPINQIKIMYMLGVSATILKNKDEDVGTQKKVISRAIKVLVDTGLQEAEAKNMVIGFAKGVGYSI